jgi:hypothetical protein
VMEIGSKERGGPSSKRYGQRDIEVCDTSRNCVTQTGE